MPAVYATSAATTPRASAKSRPFAPISRSSVSPPLIAFRRRSLAYSPASMPDCRLSLKSGIYISCQMPCPPRHSPPVVNAHFCRHYGCHAPFPLLLNRYTDVCAFFTDINTLLLLSSSFSSLHGVFLNRFAYLAPPRLLACYFR